MDYFLESTFILLTFFSDLILKATSNEKGSNFQLASMFSLILFFITCLVCHTSFWCLNQCSSWNSTAFGYAFSFLVLVELLDSPVACIFSNLFFWVYRCKFCFSVSALFWVCFSMFFHIFCSWILLTQTQLCYCMCLFLLVLLLLLFYLFKYLHGP